MVQVTQDPHDADKQPIVPPAAGQNMPADHKGDRLTSVTNEAYKLVAYSMMDDNIQQTDPIMALSLLDVALTNRNVPLAKHYIVKLHALITKTSALRILGSISRWIHMPEADQQLNFEPSAPPFAENDEERNDNWMKEPLKQLRDAVLLEIDKHGDWCLKQPEIQNLHYLDILEITTRDSLQVSSELFVYSAIMQWADKECQRKGLATEDVNIKAVMKELIFAPRYGLMSKKEFHTRTIENHRGPDRIGIPTDINEKIVNFLKLKGKKRPTEELPYKMSRERKKSCPISISETESPVKEKMIINFLTCFSAVFD